MKQLLISSCPHSQIREPTLCTALGEKPYCSRQVQILLHLPETPSNVLWQHKGYFISHGKSPKIDNASWNSASMKSSRTQAPACVWLVARGREEGGLVPSFFPLEKAAWKSDTLLSHLISQNLITRSYWATKKTGECLLLGSHKSS